MSDTMTPAVTHRVPHTPATFQRRARAAFAAEWIKLRSLRSMLFAPLLTVFVCVVLATGASASNASQWSGLSAADKATFNPLDVNFQFVLIAPLFIGTLGALVATSEYTRGLIRTTLAATPQRGLVLAAKAVLVGLIAFAVSAVICFTAFFAGQAMFSGKAPHVSLSDPGVLGHVWGSVYYLTAAGLIGLFIGVLVRSTAGAIVGVFALMLVVPILVNEVHGGVATEYTVPYLPLNLGVSLWHSYEVNHVSGGVAMLDLAAWVVGLGAVAVLALRGRDA